MTAPPPLTLASASSRRLDLLRQIGVEPDAVTPSDLDETPRARELPRDYARRLARDKVAVSSAKGLVLAADTVVACGRRILPKAETEAEARACLALLSGRAHRVYTALALRTTDGGLRERLQETRVQMKRLTAAEISAYIASGEWKGKAGGYAIQGRAAVFIRGLNGSYSCVVGLPLFETAQLLTGAGYPLTPHGDG